MLLHLPTRIKKSPLFHRCYSEGDAAACGRCVVGVTKPLALQTTRSRLRPCQVCGGGGGVEGVCQHQRFQNSIASQPLIIYFNYPISDCSTLLIMLFVIVLHKIIILFLSMVENYNMYVFLLHLPNRINEMAIVSKARFRWCR